MNPHGTPPFMGAKSEDVPNRKIFMSPVSMELNKEINAASNSDKDANIPI